MKTPLRIGAMIFLMMTALWLVPQKVSAQNDYINLQVFYDELGYYGTWVDNPIYGYVWVPNVNSDFRPYVTDGHWIFTDYGWTWSSDLPWGWATFHYGRWYWDEEYGNVWVPGTEWGPAWVVWKKAPGYYGWAPMTPGMNTLYSRSNYIPLESWCFVRDRDLMQYDLTRYYINPDRYFNLIRRSTLIISMRYDSRFKYSYVYGPSQYEFQRYYGRTLNPIRIYDSYRPGQSLDRDRYSIYRPQFYRKGASQYSDSRPQSYIKDHERIIVTPNNNYYRHPREKETGRSNGLYNNGARNRENTINEPRRGDNRDNGNSNNTYNRPANTNEPSKYERPNSGNNNNRGNNDNNVQNPNNRNNDNRGNNNNAQNPNNRNNDNRGGSNATGNQNNDITPNNYRKIDPTTLRQQPGTNNPATGNNNNNRGGSNVSGSGNNPNTGNSGNSGNNNNNNRGGSNASGSGNNNPNTGNSSNSGNNNNNNRGGSNASGSGNNNPNAGTPAPNNTGRGNVNPNPQTNKQDNSKKPATDQNKKEEKKDNKAKDEKKDLRSKVQPISI